MSGNQVERCSLLRGAEGFDEGDEVEEETGDGGGNGDTAPAGPVVEGSRKNRESSDAVEQDGGSEPEEGHDGGER